MIRAFVGAFLWVFALWTVGAWLEANVGLPEQIGLLGGLVVAALFVGYGLRLAVAGRSRAPAAGTVTTN